MLSIKIIKAHCSWRKTGEICVLEILDTLILDIFFVKDRIDNGEVRVQYCPTGLMLADCYTKPLMGAKFREFREYIMGWRNAEDLIKQINDTNRIKERVEDSEFLNSSADVIQFESSKNTSEKSTSHHKKVRFSELNLHEEQAKNNTKNS